MPVNSKELAPILFAAFHSETPGMENAWGNQRDHTQAQWERAAQAAIDYCAAAAEPETEAEPAPTEANEPTAEAIDNRS